MRDAGRPLVSETTTKAATPSKLVKIDLTGMSVQGARGSFVDYWVGLWDARAFMVHEARAKITGGVGRDKLGNLWLIINPLLTGAMFYFIFGVMLNSSRGIENFIGYLSIGIFMFTLTNGLIGQSADAIFGNRSVGVGTRYSSLVRVAMVNIRVWMSSLPSYFVLLLLIILVPPVERFSWMSLLFLPIVVMQGLMALGISFLLAHAVSRLSDIKHLWSVVSRGWLYASGVFYSVDRLLGPYPELSPLVDANPMHHVLDMSRDVLLYDTMPGAFGWIVLGLWSIGGLLLGSFVLWRAEGSYKFDDE